MQEITFYPSKAKYLLMLSGSLLFTAVGVWMAYDGEWTGHFVYLFSGLCSVLVVIMLLTNASYLKLSDDEFETGRLFGKRCVKWENVEGFQIWTYSNGHFTIEGVGWNYKEDVDVSKFARINKKLGAHELLPELYGMKAEKLLSLMNEHLANHRDKRSRFR